MTHTQIVAQDWNLGSDKYYAGIYGEDELDRIEADPLWAFPPDVRGMLADVSDFRGKRVLVPSSGDNAAVFAFHLMGARVTSADIAERQLFNARKIAQERGWDIEFVQEDTMRLARMEDGAYDLVYTSNGVHVWIDDLSAMYRSIFRVLKPGGRYIMFETHPFIRPFDSKAAEEMRFSVVKPYEDTGPFGAVPTYGWRVMDLANAMLFSGLRICRMVEFHSQMDSFDCWWYRTLAQAQADGYARFDWTKNPFAALPQWIGFSAKKDG